LQPVSGHSGLPIAKHPQNPISFYRNDVTSMP
jgi:hypothetical protein